LGGFSSGGEEILVAGPLQALRHANPMANSGIEKCTLETETRLRADLLLGIQ
jgi:hypothetical protein